MMVKRFVCTTCQQKMGKSRHVDCQRCRAKRRNTSKCNRPLKDLPTDRLDTAMVARIERAQRRQARMAW